MSLRQERVSMIKLAAALFATVLVIASATPSLAGSKSTKDRGQGNKGLGWTALAEGKGGKGGLFGDSGNGVNAGWFGNGGNGGNTGLLGNGFTRRELAFTRRELGSSGTGGRDR